MKFLKKTWIIFKDGSTIRFQQSDLFKQINFIKKSYRIFLFSDDINKNIDLEKLKVFYKK